MWKKGKNLRGKEFFHTSTSQLPKISIVGFCISLACFLSFASTSVPVTETHVPVGMALKMKSTWNFLK